AGQTLMFSTSIPSAGSLLFSSQPVIDASTGDLTYTPEANAFGTATVEVVLIDNGAFTPPNSNVSSVHTFTITINPVNDPPSFDIAASPPPSNEDAVVSIPTFATSISPGPNESTQTVSFTVTMTGSTNGLTFSSAAISPEGTLTYTPAPNANGTATFDAVAFDNLGGSSTTHSFTIIVLPVNDPPTFTIPADVPVDEDSGAHTFSNFLTSISPGPPDESAQTVTVALTGNDSPQFFSAGPSLSPSGALSFTLVPLAHGVATITVTATDNGPNTPPDSNTSSQTFTITIHHVNHPPSASAQTFNILEDAAPFDITLATDPDGDPLTFTFDAFPNLGSLTPSGPTFTYSPFQDYNGTDTFTFTATDPDGASVTQTITVNIAPVNDPPQTSDQSFTTDDDAPVGLPLAHFTYDPDNDPLTFAIVTPPAHGTISGTFPNILYTPSEAGPLTDTLTFSATDPSNTSSTSTITITTVVHTTQGTEAEFIANSDTGQFHLNPAVAFDGAGNFVVVWNSQPDVFGQRFDATGAKVGSEFQVTTTGSNAISARVAMDVAGNFVVVWTDQSVFPQQVHGQRFHSDGTKNGGDFVVFAAGEPDVAMSASGSFLITGATNFESDGSNTVLAQLYDSSGVAQSGPRAVNTTRVNDIIAVTTRVAAAAGSFVVVWDLDNVDGGYTFVHGRILDSAGVPQGVSDFVLGTGVYSDSPAVTGNGTGHFVAIWSDDGGIRAQRYDSAGTAIGAQVTVTAAFDQACAIAMDSTGNFVAAWQDASRIFGRRFDSSSTPGPIFRVNSPTPVIYRDVPDLALSDTGRFVAVWQGVDPFTSTYNVYAAFSLRTATSTSLLSSLNPSTAGQSVTFTATVTPSAATGTVTFKDGTTPIGTQPLAGGSAALTTSALSKGTHSITATYNGDSYYGESTSSTLTQTVNAAISAPASVTATANSTSQVSVSWSAVTGATGYEVWRSSMNGAYGMVASTASQTATSVADSLNIQPNTTYLYKVLAQSAAGPSDFSPIDAATTIVFTDPSLAGAGLKTVHITQLQTAVNAMRAAAGLSAVTFTDVTQPANRAIRASNIVDLRTALAAARLQIGLTTLTYTDGTLTPLSTRIKAVHVTDLRGGVQ
ncbi:MAG: tandem-95 repeat protein, partial [Thermoanaerobaculia bacterium]